MKHYNNGFPLKDGDKLLIRLRVKDLLNKLDNALKARIFKLPNLLEAIYDTDILENRKN